MHPNRAMLPQWKLSFVTSLAPWTKLQSSCFPLHMAWLVSPTRTLQVCIKEILMIPHPVPTLDPDTSSSFAVAPCSGRVSFGLLLPWAHLSLSIILWVSLCVLCFLSNLFFLSFSRLQLRLIHFQMILSPLFVWTRPAHWLEINKSPLGLDIIIVDTISFGVTFGQMVLIGLVHSLVYSLLHSLDPSFPWNTWWFLNEGFGSNSFWKESFSCSRMVNGILSQLWTDWHLRGESRRYWWDSNLPRFRMLRILRNNGTEWEIT